MCEARDWNFRGEAKIKNRPSLVFFQSMQVSVWSSLPDSCLIVVPAELHGSLSSRHCRCHRLKDRELKNTMGKQILTVEFGRITQDNVEQVGRHSSIRRIHQHDVAGIGSFLPNLTAPVLSRFLVLVFLLRIPLLVQKLRKVSKIFRFPNDSCGSTIRRKGHCSSL